MLGISLDSRNRCNGRVRVPHISDLEIRIYAYDAEVYPYDSRFHMCEQRGVQPAASLHRQRTGHRIRTGLLRGQVLQLQHGKNDESRLERESDASSLRKARSPQTLNLYSYVGNNPLSRTDPTGHYVINCGGDVKNCSQQQKNFNNALAAGLKSKDQSVVQAAKAYGGLGEKNGVNVSIVNVVDAKNSNVAGTTGAQAGTGGLQSTDGGKTFMQATQVNIQAGLSGNQLSDVAVHEGQHVGDRENFINGLGVDQSGKLVQGLNITRTMSELNAYGVENANRGMRGDPTRDVNDILSHPPYGNDPNMGKPIFPDFPSPY